MTSPERELVLVTGAAGFIATHIVQQLLAADYRVRGTVRSTQNQEKCDPLRQLGEAAKSPLELVEADLTSEGGWREAVRGATYVIHAASPFPDQNPKEESEVIGPAVDGTLHVLRACRDVGGVRRVVLTSSTAAITEGLEERAYTESDWLDVDACQSTYMKSKALSEKAAWGFVAGLPEDEKFELVAINPFVVIGPVLCGGWATSMSYPKMFLERLTLVLPKFYLGVVDVRDVARAHVVGLTNTEAAGRRHILCGGHLWVREMGEILDKEFRPLGYDVPLREAPYLLIKLKSFFNKSLLTFLPTWGKRYTLDNSRMRDVLGIEPRPPAESFVDMAYSMIERGFVKQTDQYKKARDAGELRK